MFWEKRWPGSVDPPPVGRHAAAHLLAEGQAGLTPRPPGLARRPDAAARQRKAIRAGAVPPPASHGRRHFQDGERCEGRSPPGPGPPHARPRAAMLAAQRTGCLVIYERGRSQTHRRVLPPPGPHKSGETTRPARWIRVCVCVCVRFLWCGKRKWLSDSQTKSLVL